MLSKPKSPLGVSDLEVPSAPLVLAAQSGPDYAE
jgi:hypothetical protein